MFNPDVFQAEHKLWLDRMYPNQPARIPLLGMIEEAGELLHAVLKLEQCKLWGDEKRHRKADLETKLRDAIGDCAIYACSFCTAMATPYSRLWRRDCLVKERNRDTADRAVDVVQAALRAVKLEPKMLLTERYMHQLTVLAFNLDLAVAACVESAWSHVKERTR